MDTSILVSTKKVLGIENEYTHFDADIIIFINNALMTLNQLGIGPIGGFVIKDTSSVWGDFLKDQTILSGIKTYVFLKVRLAFDPPQMGYFVDAIKDQIKELEWRLNVYSEGGVINNG